MASSERLSDYHFHAALEGHSKIVSGVFERPVYGLGWKGESSYYKTGLKEELEEKEGEVVRERKEWEEEVEGLEASS
mgnify:CR=1 FL=1